MRILPRLEWTLNPMVGALSRKGKGEDTQTQRRPCEDRSREWCNCHKLRNARSHWRLQKATIGSILETSEGIWPWWCFDFRFVAFRTVWELISLVSNQICDHLLQQTRKANISSLIISLLLWRWSFKAF